MSPTFPKGSLDPDPPQSNDGTLKLRLDNSAVGSAAAIIRSGSGVARTVVVRGDPLSIPVAAGEVTVEMQLPSGELLVQRVDMRAGGEEDLTFEVDPSGKDWLRWQSVVSPNWRPRGPKPVRSSRQKQRSIVPDFSYEEPPPAWRERIREVVRVGLSGKKRYDVPIPVDKDYFALLPDLTVEGDERALSVTFFSPLSSSPTPHGKTALAVRLQPIDDEPALTVCAMIPSPWRSTWGPETDQPQRVQVLVQAQPTGVGGVSMEVIIQDKQVGPVLAYLGTGDLGSAGAYADDLQHMARELLWEKVANPFAAAVGAYLMLRLEVSELSWTEHLWRRFPWLPDGGIVHAAHLLRSANRSSNLDVVRDALVSAAQSGVPFFVDGVRRLTAGLSQIASSSRFKGDAEVIGALRYARALSSATMPQAQCTTLIVPSERLDDLLFGATHFSNSQLAVGAP